MRSFSWLSLVATATVFASTASAQVQTLKQSDVRVAPNERLEDAARRAVLAGAPAALELGAGRTAALRTGRAIVKLSQMHLGVPVALRGATVTFQAGAATHVALRIERDLPDDVAPALDAASAAKAATAMLGLAVDASRATLAVWPAPNGSRLAWIIYPKPIAALRFAPLLVIDAQSGERLLAYNAVVGLDQANVYPSNPVKSPELMSVTLPVADGQTALQNALVKSQNCIDNGSVKTVFNLTVHTCDLAQTAIPDQNGDYLLTPGADTEPEDSFSEVSMFYHANHAYDFFRSFQPDFLVQASALDTVSNLRMPAGYLDFDLAKMSDPTIPLEPFQNAFFAPSNPIFSQVFGLDGAAMWFGQGPKRDYSYDGDVIYHEFTHSVVAATLNLVGFAHADEYGLSQAPSGMNEGLADYFSSAITGDPDVGEYAAGDIGDLDKIRSLTDPDKCPNDIGGEAHQDATLFSGGLWDTRSTLSVDDARLFDEAVFAAMNKAPSGDLGYEDLAQLIVDAVGESALGDATAQSLEGAFTARGVLPKCKRILEYEGVALNGPAKLQSLWFAPGLSATTLKAAAYAPGIVQVHVPLPERTTALQVQFKGMAAPGGGGPFGQQGSPFEFKLLARFGSDPITFSYGPFAAAEGVAVVDLAKDASVVYSATLEVPAGTSDAYIMIANLGDQDGVYTNLSFTTTQAPPDEEQPPPGDEPGPTNPTTLKTDAPEPEDSSGCGCSIPGEAPASRLAALVAVALAALSRRKRR